jgi:hypothetical protein
MIFNNKSALGETTMTTMTTAAKVQQILEQTNYDLFLGAMGHPKQGQFVTTGPQMGGSVESRVGYCVQVRKGRGAYSSNVVFLRHPDGGLTTHENQAFFGLTAAQEVLAREIFVDLPEDEDYSHGYSIQGQYEEVGFLIEDQSGAHPAAQPGGGVRLTVKSTKDNGRTETTLIAFI